MNLAGVALLLIAIKFCMNYGVDLGVTVAIATTAAIELIHKIERFNSGWSALNRWGDDSAEHMAFNFECRWQLLAMRLYFYWKYLFLSLASFPHFKTYKMLRMHGTTMSIICEATTTPHAHAFMYSFKRHCALCNRINTLDPLYVCTGMKCTQRDASMNRMCQHYLHCTSIITAIIIASSFVNESYRGLCSAQSLYGLLKGWWIRICSGRFIVFCNFYLLRTIGPSTHAHKMPIFSNTVTINIIALQWNVYCTCLTK